MQVFLKTIYLTKIDSINMLLDYNNKATISSFVDAQKNCLGSSTVKLAEYCLNFLPIETYIDSVV